MTKIYGRKEQFKMFAQNLTKDLNITPENKCMWDPACIPLPPDWTLLFLVFQKKSRKTKNKTKKKKTEGGQKRKKKCNQAV